MNIEMGYKVSEVSVDNNIMNIVNMIVMTDVNL